MSEALSLGGVLPLSVARERRLGGEGYPLASRHPTMLRRRFLTGRRPFRLDAHAGLLAEPDGAGADEEGDEGDGDEVAPVQDALAQGRVEDGSRAGGAVGRGGGGG